jgi:prolyl 4-hydroxylase
MLVYLNTVPEEYGGHTAFPKLGLQVSPLANSAIVFNDCLPNGQEDPRTLHGGSPPGNHTKIAINIWIRAQSMRRGFFG